MGLFSPVVWTRLFNHFNHDKVFINKTVSLAIVEHTSSLAINWQIYIPPLTPATVQTGEFYWKLKHALLESKWPLYIQELVGVFFSSHNIARSDVTHKCPSSDLARSARL